MADHIYEYPVTGSTLTIRDPNNLIERVITNPREYYLHPALEKPTYSYNESTSELKAAEIRARYPDLLLIPRNGSLIFKYADETKKTKHEYFYKDGNRYEESPAQEYTTDITATMVVEQNHDFFQNENTTILKDDCFRMQFIKIEESLNWWEWNTLAGKDSCQNEHNTYEKYTQDIKITIDGIPNFFQSNADLYFCVGNDAKDPYGKAYFSAYYPEPKLLGYFTVEEPDEYYYERNRVIDLYGLAMFRNKDRNGINENDIKWSGIQPDFDAPNNSTIYHYPLVNGKPTNITGGRCEEEKTEDELKCQGFNFCMSYFHDRNPEYNNDKSKYSTLQGKTINFWNDYLVALNTMRKVNKEQQILEQVCTINKENGKLEINENSNLNYVSIKLIAETTKVKESLDNVTNDFLYSHNEYSESGVLNYYSRENPNLEEQLVKDNSETLLIPSQILKKYLHTLKFDIAPFGKFINYYATENLEHDEIMKRLINPSGPFPMREFGLNLYPVFQFPKCNYLEIADKNKSKSRDSLRDTLTDELDSIYTKNGYSKIVASDFKDSLEVAKMLFNVWKSPAKLKIIYINTPVVSWSWSKDKLTYTHAKIALKNKETAKISHSVLRRILSLRTTGSYIICLPVDYAAGLIEENSHGNGNYIQYINSEKLSQINEGSLAASRMILYGNVQSGRMNNDVRGFICNSNDILSKTYEQFSTEINTLVDRTRNDNLVLLGRLMYDVYGDFQTLLDLRKFTDKESWNNLPVDQYTSTDSIAGFLLWYNNLTDEAQREKLKQKYPILFLYETCISPYTIGRNINILNEMLSLKFEKEEVFFKGEFVNLFGLNRSLCHKMINIFRHNAGPYMNHEIFGDGGFWMISKRVINKVKKLPEYEKKVKAYVHLCFRLYQTLRKMAENSQALCNLLNKSNLDVMTYLLLDYPQIKCFDASNDNRFQDCYFLKYPGFNQNDIKIDANELTPLVFNNQ